METKIKRSSKSLQRLRDFRVETRPNIAGIVPFLMVPSSVEKPE
jgi:hypothetical protein